MTNDQAFKDIFGYPAMVRALLHWFAAGLHGLGELVASLDLARLERRNEQTVLPGTDGRRMRQASDVVWHAPFAGIPDAERKPWQELVMPWEFQSEPNHLMPLRTRAYVDGQHLERVKRRRLGSTERLAPVLPIVVYTGEEAWPAPPRVEHLLPPLPGMPRPASPEAASPGRALLSGEGYLTLDIAALGADDFDDGNAMSLLARLTHPRAGESTPRRARALLELLRDEPPELRKAAFAWIRQVSGLDLGAEDMETVNRLPPAEQERHFAGKYRIWSNQVRAEVRARTRAEMRATQLADERERLRMQAELKFDTPTADRLAESLAAIDDGERLVDVARWIIVCDTSEELIGRISQAKNGRS